MTVSIQLHVAFYVTATILSVTVLMFTIVQRRTDRPQNKPFIIILGLIIANAVSATIAAYAHPRALESHTAYMLLESSMFLYFILHSAMSPMLYYYVLSVTGTLRRRSSTAIAVYALPFLATEVLAFTNPFFHTVFFYGTDMSYNRSWGMYIIYGVAALYFVLATVHLMSSWNAINSRRRMALSYFFLLAITGVIIQLIFVDIKCELFAEALALLGAMLAVESEDDRMHPDTGIYNRRALQMDINNSILMGDKVPLIFIKVLNTKIVERVTGSSNDDVLSLACAEFFKTLLPRHQIYHPNPSAFVLDCRGADLNTLEKKIHDRFEKEWDIAGASFLFKAVVIKASIPDQLQSVGDVFYVADSLIPANISKKEADVGWLLRRAEIERAIRRSVEEGHFEVYYQPTYHVDNSELHGAEALVRMNDSVAGFVSPEEFIPVAEQIGLIGDVDEFVLRDVCEFLKNGTPSSKVMECINVNLSVIECLRPEFVSRIVDIVDSYGVAHDRLNFEITESVKAEDYEALAKVASELKKNGFSLSMDDYGTGFSNMESIFALDFDIVKIDKSILWHAEKETRGAIILEHSIRMIHSLGLKVLVEGVETESHLRMVRDFGVDYLQGFYFSKPVPKAEFVRLPGLAV